MSNKIIDCRSAAALCLASIHNGLSLNQQLPLFELRVNERERPLFRQLCYGVLRFYPRLTGISKQLLDKPLKKKDADVFMLILLGGYQLTESRVPAHAAISETVSATKTLKKHWAKALVNGVLRQWQRSGESLIEKLSAHEQLAHPEWLYNALNTAWPESAADIMQQNNIPAPMCLRINQRKTSVKDYLEKLQQADIQAEPCEFAPFGIRLTHAVNVNKLPAFFDGKVSVQDEAAQLSAPLLSLEKGQRVLDACCAPGGKTCHILEDQPELEQVLAIDLVESRLEKVSDNLSRLGLNATVTVGDAEHPDRWWDGQQFDRILLDAPCSATGVIRRNPDIKLHRLAEDISLLANQQLLILGALWQTLKPGGLLLYATCSVLPEENEQVIEQFCRVQQQAEHMVIEANWGEARPFGRQLFAQPNGNDGFYYALLRKKIS